MPLGLMLARALELVNQDSHSTSLIKKKKHSAMPVQKSRQRMIQMCVTLVLLTWVALTILQSFLM